MCVCVNVGVGGVPPEDNLAPVDCLYLSETTDVDLLWKQVAEAESLAHAVQPSLQTAVSAPVKLPPTNLAFHNTTQHNAAGKTAAAAKFCNVDQTPGGFLCF